MKAIRLARPTATEADIKGRVLVHDLGPDLRKGSILQAKDLHRVNQSGEIHVIELEHGDVHEEAAAARRAAARSGPGLEATRPVQSQARRSALGRALVPARGTVIRAFTRHSSTTG